MRYLCTHCNYIYDEDRGEIDDNIKPGTKFENLGDSFACPGCNELAEVFHEIKEEINYLSEIPFDALEAEHFINTEFDGENNIKITVGKGEPHSTGAEHRISSIGIYDEYGDLVYENFFMESEEAILEFDISDLDDFEIRAKCSIHGVWGVKIER